MPTRDIFKPRNPSRKEILDTIGDQGMEEYRNPVHLRAIKDSWPNRAQNRNERVDADIMGMEMTPSHRNGSLK